MNYCFKTVCLAILAGSICLGATAQEKPIVPVVPAVTPPATPPKAVPKPYKEVITNKSITSKGLFTMHKVEDKYYAELPLSLLGRDILIVNRVSKSSVESPKGFGGYAGDQIGEKVIRFEQGPNNKVFIRNISYNVNPDSTD